VLRPGRKILVSLASAAILAGALIGAAGAAATFHEMSIRQIYIGEGANTDDEFVQLQMWASNQNQVGGHSLTFYDKDGNLKTGTGVTVTFPSDVPNGENNRSILIATPKAFTHFGVTSDVTITDLDRMEAAGGAVCWVNVDCVSYGAFNNTTLTPLPSPTGTPASLPGANASLTRTIAPSCPTFLEAGDDSNDSATDFSSTSPPAPRNNASAILETPCFTPPSGSGPTTTVPTQAFDLKAAIAKCKKKFPKGSKRKKCIRKARQRALA
jgi:hypothetical protein